MSRTLRFGWLLLLGVAALELIAHGVVRSRVVDDGDFERAAARVRAEWQPGDRVIVAPDWADPRLRRVLGDLIELGHAGRMDLAGAERLWALSLRGHRPLEAPAGAPEFSEQIGRVRLLRWDLDEDEVLYDFVEAIEAAQVTRVDGGRELPCRWQSIGRPRGGGLGAGPITPPARHVCDPARPWVWVGATIIEDLHLRPRRCVWQHPAGPEPIAATFEDVPLGEVLTFGGGIYYEHERTLDHGPIDVRVLIDGEEAGRIVWRDGDGFRRFEVTPPAGRERGVVRVEVSAPDPHLRSFCWAGSSRMRGAR